MNTQPTSTVDFPVWKSRWQALEASIASYQKRLDEYLEKTDDRSIEILRDTLINLKDFAYLHFDFFYDGFGDHKTYNLAWSNEYPPNYIFGVTLKQVAYDLEVIQRAAEHRIWGAVSPKIQAALDQADILANNALKRVNTVLSDKVITIEEARVITYFEKSASVRFFPYTKVALIAIPFTCIPGTSGITAQNARDYVPLLHELGHYIFWHNKVKTRENNETPIHQILNQELVYMKTETPWCYRWVEEIFADVLGCIIGGPVIALSAQELALVTTEKDFTNDDREHPIPVLRPEIYTQILHKLESNQAGVEHLRGILETQWQRKQKERYKPKQAQSSLVNEDNQGSQKTSNEIEFLDGEFTVFEEQNNSLQPYIPKSISFADAREKIEEVINKIVEKVFNSDSSLLEEIFTEFWQDTSFSLAGEGNVLEKLPVLFKDHLKKLVCVEPLTSSSSAPTKSTSFSTPPISDTWRNWVNTNKFLKEDVENYTKQNTIDAIREEEKGKKGWLNVLYAGGWATRGPTNNPSVK